MILQCRNAAGGLSIALAALLSGCVCPKSSQTAHADSLAEAWHVISNKQFVDLTHTSSPTTPVWLGFGPAIVSPAPDPSTGRPYTIEKDGFRATQYTLVGQYGTHILANGHEAMDTDTTPDMKSETWLLRHGHWQIEMLANLDQVPATGALVVVAWPKPKGGLGFPVRAFAMLP